MHPAFTLSALIVLAIYIPSGWCLSCYQCDSRFDPDCKEQFDHEHLDQLILRPTECTVDAAQYCIKTIGVWGGIVGTTRFCSSRDMFNSCQYVTYPNHNRIYRACIFTCGSDNCNAANVLTMSFNATVICLLATVLIAFRLC